MKEQLNAALAETYKLHTELRALIPGTECGPGVSREDVANAMQPDDPRYAAVRDLLPRFTAARDRAWTLAYTLGYHLRAAKILLSRRVGTYEKRVGTRIHQHMLWDSAVSFCTLQLRESVLNFDPTRPGVSFANRVLEDAARSFTADVMRREDLPLTVGSSADGERFYRESIDSFYQKFQRAGSGEESWQLEIGAPPLDNYSDEDEPELPVGIRRQSRGKPYLAIVRWQGKEISAGSFRTVREAEVGQRLALERLAKGLPARQKKSRDLPKGISRNGKRFRVCCWDKLTKRKIYVGSCGSIDEALELRDAEQEKFDARFHGRKVEE